VVRNLNLKSVLSNSKYKLLVLLVSITCAATGYFLLTRIDTIVHGQLYDFGLIFSAEWADSYRVYMWSIYACLATPVVLSDVSLVFGLLRQKQRASSKLQGVESPRKAAVRPLKPPNKAVETSEPPQRFSEKALASARAFEERVREASEIEMFSEKNPSSSENNLEVEVEQQKEPLVAVAPLESENQIGDMMISCPKCKKTFRRPLIMLDFGEVKPRLVNVCPYCNQVLGNSEAEEDVFCNINVADEMVKYGDT